MKNVYVEKFEKIIDKLSNLNTTEIHEVTGVTSVLTALIGTCAFVFGNVTLLALSPLILLTSFHCNFLMENKIK